ncbi:biotin-dependent carboxyltransferase family protein [Ochrobactrum sp. Q0168]|uniref:5-oxoprolinase subunit C family protein n=1 Tax=Ochrobactrum sp. Q0168 TaxID=2793241 RepID=UPI0018EE308F|nr:biotin-dependent carboxyltransferase family protein [Ochrobactrum sp. Q0168]
MIEIVQPGILSTIQDLGRPSYRQIGVTASGAMDPLAFQAANILAGNPRNEAAIEIALGGTEIHFPHDTVFALTGTNINSTLDGSPVPGWWVQQAHAGQVLKTTPAGEGMYAYLAIAGGFAIEPVLGSVSTDRKGGFGGIGGRALKTGDQLPLRSGAHDVSIARGFGFNTQKFGLLETDNVIRMLPAAEWDNHDSSMQQSFLESDWRIQPDSNRIGYRLAGPTIEAIKKTELFSHGILPGVIQLPPSGQPVVQMNDANTCGGYPKLGVIIGADLRKLAQTRLGGHVRFARTDHETAIAAARASELRLNQLEAQATLAWQMVRKKAA